MYYQYKCLKLFENIHLYRIMIGCNQICYGRTIIKRQIHCWLTDTSIVTFQESDPAQCSMIQYCLRSR